MTRGDYLLGRVYGLDHKPKEPFHYCIVLCGDQSGYYVNALAGRDSVLIRNVRIFKRHICYQVNDVARIVELKLKGLTL
jgi:hypothetical protein